MYSSNLFFLGKKRKSSENEEKYYKDVVFCQVLKKAGLTLKTGKTQNVLGDVSNGVYSLLQIYWNLGDPHKLFTISKVHYTDVEYVDNVTGDLLQYDR